MDTNTGMSPAEVNLDSGKRRRRRRRRGKRQANDTPVVQYMDSVNKNLEHSGNGNICIIAEGSMQDTTMEEDSVIKLTLERLNPDTVSTTNPLEKPTKSRRKKRRGRAMKKINSVYGPQGMDHTVIMSNLSLVDACDGHTDGNINKIMATAEASVFSTTKESVISPPEYVHNADFLSRNMSSEVVNEAPNLLVVPCNFPTRAPVVRRKLLILDVNGLLADIVMPPPLDYTADNHILGRAIFRRPFYYEFLKFCCDRFDVGIWSSRSKRIIDRVVEYLVGDLRHRLLFCWDMFQCTETGFKTLENMHKPLVCKELRKLWGKHYPNLPWEIGDYDESNTLLLDDSPYKALLNPINTAIFPYSYHYGDKSDNSLGPGGDLRVYLEGLATTDNVQKYIEQHPFGQRVIDETSSQWGFYSRVLGSLSTQSTKSL